MGLGVLDDRHHERTPGTTRYFDDPGRQQAASASDVRRFKCTSGPNPIILVPQPSDDPNDPLNWSLWKRDRILIILSIVSVFATSLGPILAANTVKLSIEFETTFTKVALLTGYFLMGVGIAGVFVIPTARIWGKRHLFILGTLMVICSSVWAGASRSYGSLLAARIFQGFGTAPFESLVNATIGDLYFVHERGKRMALANLAVFGGSFFTPILVGKITYTIGWQWTFYFIAIFTSICFPFVICFVFETAYRRSAFLSTDLASTDGVQFYPGMYDVQTDVNHPTSISLENKSSARKQDPQEPSFDTLEGIHHAPYPAQDTFSQGDRSTPMTYKESLRLFSGRKSDEQVWKLVLRPFPLFAQPAILWACLIQGTLIGWTVFIGIILAVILIGPPLFWTEVRTGYAYTGAFIGAILGFVVAAALSDWSAKVMTRRNGGIYEPEFRIVLVIPQLIFGCVGLYGFGITASKLVNYSWIWPIFFFGCEVMGMVIGTVASALYIIDAHRDIAIEAFTCLLMFKNFFSFGLTYSAYDWLVSGGTSRTFLIISSLQVGICFLSVPMYVFGKKNRSFFHRHDILRLAKLA